MRKVNVTTKITRAEVGVAQQADPRRKRVHWRQKLEGQRAMSVIIEKMDRLVTSISKNVFVRFSHGRDRAMEPEDLIATVKGELVLALYRYQLDGKYEPLNYLLGVTHVVLKNVHNRRNRKKRIPLNMLVSMNTPRMTMTGDKAENTTLEDYLKDSMETEDPDSVHLVNRLEVEKIFESVKDKYPDVKVKGKVMKVDLGAVVKMILDGGTVASVSRSMNVPKHVMRKLIRAEIVPVLTN